MVDNGKWVTTEDEANRHKADALLAFDTAKREQYFLLVEIEKQLRMASKVTRLLQEGVVSSHKDEGLFVELISLPQMEYGDLFNLHGLKALLNAFISKKRQCAELKEKCRQLGVGE